MNILFSPPEPETPLSLATQLQLGGTIRWRQLSSCKLTYSDDPAEPIEVFVIRKRQLHVVTDLQLRNKRIMAAEQEEPVRRPVFAPQLVFGV